jgi:light-regulated signal transduction histidine kinase (bacteriophytochrome)
MSVGERSEIDFDRFVYYAGHDLQEPLRKVLSFGELLMQDLGPDLNEQARRDLQHITNAAQRMQELVQGLLLLSRVGRSPLQIRPVSLRQCVERALEAPADGGTASDAEIRIDDLPTVCGDPAMLVQVYRQLLGNALKFRTDRHPCILVTVKQAGHEWLLEVEDNGIGIEPDKTEEIFEPFRRLHSREQYPGCGIGLAICRTIIGRHGGRIWVDSIPDVGSTFRFTLPI